MSQLPVKLVEDYRVTRPVKVGTFNGIPFWSVNEMIIYTEAKKQQRRLNRIWNWGAVWVAVLVIWYFIP